VDRLDLLDWRRRISELYASVRNSDPERGWELWRATRDEMFRNHPQSPIPQEQRSSFKGLSYFEYDSSARVLADVTPAESAHFEISTSDGGSYGFTRFATVEFTLLESQVSLEVYWLDGYAGGLFLPFRDGTAGTSTYGAGRYMLDSVKSADLGSIDGKLILDFNFAYHPSCAYDSKWACPLAPPANRIEIPIEAGERLQK
jgi:uncharacterized protein (DUF1684 family)